MTSTVTSILLVLAGVGLSLLGVQLWVLARHMKAPSPSPSTYPGISILKPLCGADDDLLQCLESFANLDYPSYEVLLGVRSVSDSAYPTARRAAELWPTVMRIVIQRGAPGLNPKVNQLITLAASAEHDVLVVSDSNVAATPDYLSDVAGYFERAEVGLVTHPVAGHGERTLGAFMDNAHLATLIAPGMVAAKQLANYPIVVGKSMALRRSDLDALGGFHAVKDVLAEDHVMGQLVRTRLDKDVVVARRPIRAVSRDRSVRGFLDRYTRWGTIQRRSVGVVAYAGLPLLNPLVAAACAAVLSPSSLTFTAFLAAWGIKAGLERAAALRLRSSTFGLRGLLALPLKDAVLFLAWLLGLVRNEVSWRGNRLAVLSGTRLVEVEPRRVIGSRLRPAALLLSLRLLR
jgi:ceramide glucosyltransferase